jgi:hypothetical protein
MRCQALQLEISRKDATHLNLFGIVREINPQKVDPGILH